MIQSGKHILTSLFLLLASFSYGLDVDFYGHDLAFNTQVISTVKAPFTINKRTVQTASNIQIRKKVYQGSSQQWKKYKPFLDGALDVFK